MKSTFLILTALYALISANAQVQLYGLTSGGGTSGGSSGLGTIFHYNPLTTSQTLDKSFVYTTPQSAARYGAYTDGGNNKLYAMATFGGLYDKGSIFEWDPTTNITVKKIDFDGINGAAPQSTLTLSNGKFYGMTSEGGVNNMGVLFEWDPVTNIYTKKIDFDGTNGNLGGQPTGAIILSGGKFFGMTCYGGTNDRGVIFEWNPATNICTKKIDFNGTNGANPFGSLTLKAGKFYGMTSAGGATENGVIFEWDPSTNIYVKKIDLADAGGVQPYGSLTLNNESFYGLTHGGGVNSKGVIFEWNPTTNIYTKKVDFNGSNGWAPNGSFTAIGGKLFGITEGGGANGKGVIFEWDPTTNSYAVKIDFGGNNNGDYPTGSLALLSGKLYGMNTAGGGVDYNNGVTFEWDPATNICTKKLNFGNTNGNQPYGSLAVSGNKLYGMTIQGGANNDGVIFEWDPVANTYIIKFDFSIYTSGASPAGTLTLLNGKFYGVTSYGGAYTNTYKSGVIFEWDPATNIYTKKIDLSETSGCYPTGALTLYNGKFYGLASLSVAPFNRGVIFEWDPATNIYTKKNGFDGGANGGLPVGSLTLSGNKFYGMTSQGGANSNGVIFEWDPVLNVLTKRIDFNSIGTGGYNAGGSLTVNNSKLYGTTFSGGANGTGVIFEFDPATNIYSKKIDFNGSDGASPNGSLIMSNGKFYGMTTAGGANNVGVIFQWDAVTNTYNKLFDFNNTNGSAPYGDLIAYNYNNTPLPIQVLSFTAVLQNKDVLTQWQIATAEEGSKYELQRASDVNNFIAINTQSGNSVSTQFSHLDRTVIDGGIYRYRLKMTDKNARVTYSNVAMIKLGSKEQTFFVFPNPIKKEATLQISLQNIKADKVEIINASGQIVYSSPAKQIGSFSLPFTSSLLPGQYLVRVQSGNQTQTQKLWIQ